MHISVDVKFNVLSMLHISIYDYLCSIFLHKMDFYWLWKIDFIMIWFKIY
jgi:hypothetical protein